MIYHPDLSKQRCSSQFNVLQLDCQDLRHEPEVVKTLERKMTWFLLKEQIDQMKGRFTESFREAWNWHYNLSSFQTAGNCKQYQKLKGNINMKQVYILASCADG